MTKINKIFAPKIWGIVNCTPDSFSDGGLFMDTQKAYAQMLKLFEDGADYVDIGAASARPSSDFISAEEEWERLEPLFNMIEENRPDLFAKISVDTWRASVAQKVLERNIFCINDISGFQSIWGEDAFLDVLVQYKPYYVLMHCQGLPQNMQDHTEYADVVDTVYSFFEERLNLLSKAGFPTEKVILDPGIGFGKNLEQNLALLNATEKFEKLGLPLMAGISRKSWLRLLLEIEKENIVELDNATANASLLLAKNGFLHHRVHNVKLCRHAFHLAKNLY